MATRRTKPTTRPRQVDYFRKLPIIRDVDQIADDDDEVPEANKPKPRIDVPIPDVTTVATYEEETVGGFRPPAAFIRYLPSAKCPPNYVEYDLDFEDESWLRNHPRFGEKGDPTTRLNLDFFERMLDILEQESGLRDVPVTLEEAEAIFAVKLHLQRSPTNKTAAEVYSYWKNKRTRLRKPLLRKFWPPTSPNDTNPHLVFRPREKERYRLRRNRQDDMESYRKMARLRADLVRAQEILDVVRQREETKLNLLLVTEDLFLQHLHEAMDTSGVRRKPFTLQGLSQVNTDMLARVQARASGNPRAAGPGGAGGGAGGRGLLGALLGGGAGERGAGRDGAGGAGAGGRGLTDGGRRKKWMAAVAQAASALGVGHALLAGAGYPGSSSQGEPPRGFRAGAWRVPFASPSHAVGAEGVLGLGDRGLSDGWLGTSFPLPLPLPRPPAHPFYRVGPSAALGIALGAGPTLLASLAAASNSGSLNEGDPTEVTDLELVHVGTAILAAAAAAAAFMETPERAALALAGGDAFPLGRGFGTLDRVAAGAPRDRGVDIPVGVGGAGAGEVEEDVLGLGTATGFPMGYDHSELGMECLRLGRQPHYALSGRPEVVIRQRILSMRNTLGQLRGGSAWEVRAGLVLGLGALGSHGEGWELQGKSPESAPLPLQEASVPVRGDAALRAILRAVGETVRGRRQLRTGEGKRARSPGSDGEGGSAQGDEGLEGRRRLRRRLQSRRHRAHLYSRRRHRHRRAGAVEDDEGWADGEGDEDEAALEDEEEAALEDEEEVRSDDDDDDDSDDGANEGSGGGEADTEGTALAKQLWSRRAQRRFAGLRGLRRPHYVSRARLARGGRVVIDRLSVDAVRGGRLRQEASLPEFARRDRLRAQVEEERAAGPLAPFLAAARAAGLEPVETPTLASDLIGAGEHVLSEAHALHARALGASRGRQPWLVHVSDLEADARASALEAAFDRASAPSVSADVHTTLLADSQLVRVGRGRGLVARTAQEAFPHSFSDGLARRRGIPDDPASLDISLPATTHTSFVARPRDSDGRVVPTPVPFPAADTRVAPWLGHILEEVAEAELAHRLRAGAGARDRTGARRHTSTSSAGERGAAGEDEDEENEGDVEEDQEEDDAGDASGTQSKSTRRTVAGARRRSEVRGRGTGGPMVPHAPASVASRLGSLVPAFFTSHTGLAGQRLGVSHAGLEPLSMSAKRAEDVYQLEDSEDDALVVVAEASHTDSATARYRARRAPLRSELAARAWSGGNEGAGEDGAGRDRPLFALGSEEGGADGSVRRANVAALERQWAEVVREVPTQSLAERRLFVQQQFQLLQASL